MEELIRKENMAVDIKASDWREAVFAAGDLLVKDGRISTAYIDKMISAVETLGPYIVLSKGFALAHCAPCEDVYETSLSLITLKEAVDFGSVNDPVKVVMCLACTDKEAHIQLLSEVARKLMNDGIIDKLLQCKDLEELYQLING